MTHTLCILVLLLCLIGPFLVVAILCAARGEPKSICGGVAELVDAPANEESRSADGTACRGHAGSSPAAAIPSLEEIRERHN